MKNITSTIMIAALLCSCSGKTMITSPAEKDSSLPLLLQMHTQAPVKGLIKSTTLPDGSTVGITVRDEYGAYSGSGFTNIPFTAQNGSGVQQWQAGTPVMLTAQSGSVYSYYPYSTAVTDITKVSVSATSSTQTDYMWGTPVSVSKDNRTASVIMKHALSAVRITYVRGTYTGDGAVSSVSFSGSCIATGAYLDITDGSLSGLSGKGSTVSPAIGSQTLSSTLQESEIIVIPTGESSGAISITIDGDEYSLEFDDIDLSQGEITQFHLTVNDGELSLSDITVSEWTYGESHSAEILVTDKVKIAGDIDDIAFYNSVTDGTVTISAVPKTPAVNKEVEPATITGSASMTQSSDIFTGVRTITVTDIESDITITFAGTYTYDLVTRWEVTGGTSTRMLYNYLTDDDLALITRIREGDNDFPVAIDHTFSGDGTHILKYSFENHEFPYKVFYGAASMTEAIISEEVTALSSYAFTGTSLTEMTIPDNVKTIGSALFYNCTLLRTVTLPEGITEIYDSMFRGCESLKVIDIPDTVTKLSDFAFNGCSSLASVIIPSGVTSIGNYCFQDCNELRLIVCLAPNTPNLTGSSRYHFTRVASGGILAVPASAQTGTNYSYWVSSGVHLGNYGWSLVYMDE